MFVIRMLHSLFFLFVPVLLMAQEITLAPTKPNSKKPGLYKLEFALQNPLLPKAAIKLQFPTDYDLAQVKIAGSNTLKGGISFAIDSTQVLLQRSGLGKAVPAGQKVSIIFGPVRHLASHTQADSVNVTFYYQGKEKQSIFQAFRIGIR